MQARGLSQTSNFTLDNPACTLTNANGQKKIYCSWSLPYGSSHVQLDVVDRGQRLSRSNETCMRAGRVDSNRQS